MTNLLSPPKFSFFAKSPEGGLCDERNSTDAEGNCTTHSVAEDQEVGVASSLQHEFTRLNLGGNDVQPDSYGRTGGTPGFGACSESHQRFVSRPTRAGRKDIH